MIRKATTEDINDVVRIYDDVHRREEVGEVTTGWLRGIYPTRDTAETSLKRGDLFVQLDETGEIVGTAIINRLQVDCYVNGSWKCDAADDEIMVIHTLVIAGKSAGEGFGSEFLDFYENYAKACGWIPTHATRLQEDSTKAMDIGKSVSHRQFLTESRESIWF